MLDVQHLRVSYGATEVLRDVSFGVSEQATSSRCSAATAPARPPSSTRSVGLVAPEAGTIAPGRGAGIDGPASDQRGAARHGAGAAGPRGVERR